MEYFSDFPPLISSAALTSRNSFLLDDPFDVEVLFYEPGAKKKGGLKSPPSNA
jgi:hypothetical protein